MPLTRRRADPEKSGTARAAPSGAWGRAEARFWSFVSPARRGLVWSQRNQTHLASLVGQPPSAVIVAQVPPPAAATASGGDCSTGDRRGRLSHYGLVAARPNPPPHSGPAVLAAACPLAVPAGGSLRPPSFTRRWAAVPLLRHDGLRRGERWEEDFRLLNRRAKGPFHPSLGPRPRNLANQFVSSANGAAHCGGWKRAVGGS